MYNGKGEIIEARLYKDLADMGGLPRVSEIAKILPNPQLERWKIDKALEVGSYEGLMDFVEEKADGGTDIHEFIENIDIGKTRHPSIKDEVCDTIVHEYRTFMNDLSKDGWQNWKEEYVVVEPRCYGYAGRSDKIMRKVGGGGETHYYEYLIIDWKTQDVKKKPEFYDNYIFQQSAYGYAVAGDLDLVDCVTMVIDRSTGKFYRKDYTQREIFDAFKAFKACHLLYCYTKNYDIEKVLRLYASTSDAPGGEIPPVIKGT